MDAIRVQNLRSLADTGFVDIRPITVLVGRNSSGKSTFLRTFPLLRQSVETRTTGPILWYGSYVDFGSFAEAIRTDAREDRIALSFRIPIELSKALDYTRFFWFSRQQPKLLQNLLLTVSLELRQEIGTGATRASAVDLSFAGHELRLEIDERGHVKSFFVNSLNVLSLGTPYRVTRSSNIIPVILPSEETSQREFSFAGLSNRKLADLFASSLRPYFHGNTSIETIHALFDQRGLGTDDQMLADLQSIRQGGPYWHHRVLGWQTDHAVFQSVRNLVLANWAPVLLEIADHYLSQVAQGVSYIAPLRASAERYYRSQELAVEEVDFQGKNLPMFLQSLSTSERKSFRSWTEQHFGLAISTSLAGGHISLRVTETNSGANYNLADVGFGLSQVLPVIAQLWAMTNRDRRRRGFGGLAPITFAIEQPELHLHPSLQARVADVLIDSVSPSQNSPFGLRVLLETHSETIINRIGQRIYRGDLSAESVSVVIFEREDETLSSVRFSEFDSEGFLTDWPIGFFQPDMVG